MSFFIKKIIIYQFILLLNIFISINAKITRHSNDIFSPHKTFIESHRGINREIFQNTLEAFSRAIQYDG